MTITIKDSNRDGKIQQSEWEAAVRGVDPNEDHEVYFNGERIAEAAKLSDLQTQMQGSIESSASNREIQEQARQEVGNVQQRIGEALQALEQAKAEQNEERMEQLRESIREMLEQYQAAAARAGISRGRQQSYLSSIRQAAGVREGTSNFKASSTGGGGGGASQTSRSANAQTTNNAAGATGFSPPANWGAQTATSAATNFNASAAYLSSMAIEDSVMSSWDNINQNQNKGKQLMMLFFYFARMAQSGDMGAMYQFMKFLTYIISKDKAKQQIEMGKKLIQLQDLSRKWTNKLLNLETNSTDPSASNELMKTMTIVKSETDAIATSQKLISQMMEEFAQVVESLTNSTKAALDAYGRILRTVSSSR